MAIIKMNRITLLALNEDRDKLLSTMQRMGCVEVSPLSEDEKERFIIQKKSESPSTAGDLARLSWTIDKLSVFNKQKTPMFGKRPFIDSDIETSVFSNMHTTMENVARAEELERENGETQSYKTKLQILAGQLYPWIKLDIPLSRIIPTSATFQLLGQIKKAEWEQVTSEWSDHLVYAEDVFTKGDTLYLWIIGHIINKDYIISALKTFGFVSAQLDYDNQTPAQKYSEYISEISKCDQRLAQIHECFLELSGQLTELKTLYDLMSLEQQRNDVYERSIRTESTFILRGWVPEVLKDKVTEKLQSVSPVCSIDICQPSEEDEPPVALMNHRGVSPFESVVSGFALPSPLGIDPTAVMAPFFACLFGMMVSDAGYGLLLGLAIPLFIKFYKPSESSKKMMWLLAIGGWFTVIWGFIYNTWFGAQLGYRIIDPLKDSLTVMMISIGVGALHLFTGLGMAAYMNIKRGRPLDAVYDQLSWLLIILGVAVMLISPNLSVAGQYAALLGVVIVLLFAGRDKRNPLKRITSGLGALYGISGWIADLLSYMRLFGMGLATGVIGMVVNQLCGMVFQSGIVGKMIGAVLFVGAHAFNAGINILGAYVHSCRLQYIEFFGKFYEEGGRPFKPLNTSTRYVYYR